MVGPENIHAKNLLQTVRVVYVFRGKTHMHTHIYVPQLTEEAAMNLRSRHMGGFEEKKGKGLCDPIILLSQKEKNLNAGRGGAYL